MRAGKLRYRQDCLRNGASKKGLGKGDILPAEITAGVGAGTVVMVVFCSLPSWYVPIVIC